MKKLFTLTLVLCMAVAVMAQQRVDKLIKTLNDPKSKKVLVVAHRGDWRNAPENSLQAFKNCIDMGVDMIELDLQRSKDGVLFVMHDDWVDRTTDGHGRVCDLTADELRRLHLKAGHGIPTRHHIPTFEQVLDLCKGQILINVDKGYDYFKEACAVMEKTGTTRQIVIKSGHTIDKVQRENGDVISRVIYMPVISIDRPDAEARINACAAIKPVAIECCFGTDGGDVPRLLQLVRSNGSKVWINSLWPSLNGGHDDDRAVELGQPDDSWGWLLKHGASIIQTDRPVQLIQYLKKHGRR